MAEGRDVWNDDDEEGDVDDTEDEESAAATIPCPECRRAVYEDAPRCPHCGHYLADDDAVPRRKPWWIIVGTVLVLYVVYRTIAG